jgi:hypothetical protein
MPRKAGYSQRGVLAKRRRQERLTASQVPQVPLEAMETSQATASGLDGPQGTSMAFSPPALPDWDGKYHVQRPSSGSSSGEGSLWNLSASGQVEEPDDTMEHTPVAREVLPDFTPVAREVPPQVSQLIDSHAHQLSSVSSSSGEGSEGEGQEWDDDDEMMDTTPPRHTPTSVLIPRQETRRAFIDDKSLAVYSLGPMDQVCPFCAARFFASEKEGVGAGFSRCCRKGKVSLPALESNPLLESLLSGQHAHSAEFKNAIRAVNSSFAFVSTGFRQEEQRGHGPYFLAIHGCLYHRISRLHPSGAVQPAFGQVYIFDTEEAVKRREANMAAHSIPVNRSLMMELTHELSRVNVYMNQFQPMYELLAGLPREQKTTLLMEMIETPNSDSRRYNLPTKGDVAAVFEAMDSDGEPPYERSLQVYPRISPAGFQTVKMGDRRLDGLAYPLLFPQGDFGWSAFLPYTRVSTTTATGQGYGRVTLSDYASYRMATRDGFSLLQRSGKLYLQWVVDFYVRMEGQRLSFIRNQQQKLRADKYSSLRDYVRTRAETEKIPVGRQVILPSTFIGSPRNMIQRYQDAMAIVRTFGKPEYFITVTCNPNWKEITEQLARGEIASQRPELIARVFHSKLKELIRDLQRGHAFGVPCALIYTIEFQKRGLPHAHILLGVAHGDKIRDVSQLDSVISAELPLNDPALLEKVTSHMIHGPCGPAYRLFPCTKKDGKAVKCFPMAFSETTRESNNSSPIYRRRPNGATAVTGGKYTVDNRNVVPYSPYLLRKFDCHINVEHCGSVESVKYLYKVSIQSSYPLY